MTQHQTVRLTFAWWNTSLSPARRPNRADEEDIDVVDHVISSLLTSLSVDCLALGEVSAEDLRRIRVQLDASQYSIVEGTAQIQRTSFDLGTIYRNTRLQKIDAVSITAAHGQHQLKIAQRVDFEVLGIGWPLHVFSSYWPSRLWHHEGHPIRQVLGVRLADAIVELRSRATIILMGDYNDEPFDAPLSRELLASRDRRLVRKNCNLLYNPFWRFLGEKEPHVPSRVSQGFPGTHYYASGDSTDWRTYDQIIFSSACLRGQPWHINEKLTCVLEIPPLDSLVPDSRRIFDHFPVISVLETDTPLSEVTNG